MSPKECFRITALLWLTCLAPSGMASRSIQDCQKEQQACYNFSIPRGGSPRFPLMTQNWIYICKNQIYGDRCENILSVMNGSIQFFNSTFQGHFSLNGDCLIVDNVTDFLQGGYKVKEKSTPIIHFHISLKPDPQNNATRASGNHLTCYFLFYIYIFSPK